MTTDEDYPVSSTIDHPRRVAPVEAIERLLMHAVEAEAAEVAHLEVVFTDHETVLDLNRRYLDHDYLTDVLAFDLSDDPASAIDGEIYVDLDTAAERCSEFGESYEREVARYALHGLLHLLGYSDESQEESDEMKEREESYLQAFAPDDA